MKTNNKRPSGIATSLKPKALFNNDYKEKATTPTPVKNQIINLFEALFSTKLQYSVLTDINITETNQIQFHLVGRAKTVANTKQLRHVTPYAFMKNLIETKVVNSGGGKKMLTSFGQIIKLALNHKKGFGFTEKILNEKGYEQIKPIVKNISRKHLLEEKNICFLVSPCKRAKIKENKTFTPTKESLSGAKYNETNPLFIETAINNLAEIIKDDQNTIILATQILTCFMFQIFNAKNDAVFPEEGNTENYEIRLYPSKKNAKKGEKNYEIISTKKLKTMYDNNIIIDGKVRLVDCEGSTTIKVIELLTKLDKIIAKHNTNKNGINTLISEYNVLNSKNLILANSDYELKDYNSKLTGENYTTQSPYHLAKLAYIMFDFKALEKTVLTKELKNGDIKLYNGAKSTKTINYSFFDGKENREIAIEEAKSKYSDKVEFRKEEIDTGFLEKKLVEHFVISISPYSAFITGFVNSENNFPEQALTALIKLAAIDYELENIQTEIMVNDSLKDFQELTKGFFADTDTKEINIFLDTPEGKAFTNTMDCNGVIFENDHD